MKKPIVPRHVGVIMDGNGRWAQKRAMPRPVGHTFGAKTSRKIIQAAIEADVQFLTLYVFSKENWKRPKTEVNLLMKLLVDMLRQEITSLMEENVVVRTLGDITFLPPQVRAELEKTLELTEKNSGMVLQLALSYGGRDEIVKAAKAIALAAQDTPTLLETLDEETFGSYLFAPTIPDPELIIRTGGEQRLSNFLLWQSAYAEFYFSPVLWPDFTEEDFNSALKAFGTRERRFGKVL
jgi:undecaprenyl diphosphate synthase